MDSPLLFLFLFLCLSHTLHFTFPCRRKKGRGGSASPAEIALLKSEFPELYFAINLI